MASRIRTLLSTSRRRRSQAGAAIVETLIFIPTIFLMTFLTLEVTNILRVYETMSWVAEYGVRQASEGMDSDGRRYISDQVRTKVRDKIRFDFPIGVEHIDFRDVFCILYFRESETPNDSDFSCQGAFTNERDFQPGDFLRVRVRLHYRPMLSGIFEWMFPDGALTMSSTFDRVISAAAPLEEEAPGRGRGGR